jgi:hypothetical protein
MADVLSHRLSKETDMTQREMVDFISEEFGEEVSTTTIARTLNKRKTTLKVIRRVAQQQVPDLQHFFYYRLKIQGCRSYHYIFIDCHLLVEKNISKGYHQFSLSTIQTHRNATE